MPSHQDKENLFYTITGHDELIREDRYKSLITHFLTIAYILIAVVTFFINLPKGWTEWIDSPVSVTLLIINFLVYRNRKSNNVYAWGLLGIGVADVIFSMLFGRADTAWPLLWGLIVAPLAVFLLDLKWGSRLSLSFFLFLALFLIFSPGYRDVHHIDNFFLFSYLFTYLFLFAINSLFVYFIKGSVQQLRHSNEIISRANKSREKFLSELSHQIRTPLNDIMAFNEMIETLDIPEKSRDMFEMIKASSQNLVQAVGTFTRLGRFSSDKKKKVTLVPFDVVRQLNQLENTINRQNKEKLEIRIRTKGFLPDQVMGAPVMLNQIVLSLVEGILRNTTTKKKIHIQSDVTFEEQEEKIMMNMIIRSVPSHPFVPEKFEQLKELSSSGVNAITENEDLPYLNLLLSMDLCAQLNGTLRLKTGENGETDIEITLPFGLAATVVKSPGAVSPEVTQEKKTSLADCNVLLVEDNPINQKIVMASLRQHVKHIDLAENGKEALDLYGKNKYDFILMDVQIPIMDGMLVTRKIREIENSTNTHTPIIAVTANAMPGDRETCLSAGMDEYLSKPFMINQLLEKMNSLL